MSRRGEYKFALRLAKDIAWYFDECAFLQVVLGHTGAFTLGSVELELSFLAWDRIKF